jgi:phenylpyruvate tautomerase PptA (4-oxalocrotonate tautomerase family)
MPLLLLNLTDAPINEQQRSALHAGLSARMASILGKRADLTVVNINQTPPQSWSLGGQAIRREGWCASLTVYITSGTNTAEEQSSFIASAFSLLEEVLEAPPAAPVYIIVNEVAAHSWGYDGRTQLSRRPKAPLQPA